MLGVFDDRAVGTQPIEEAGLAQRVTRGPFRNCQVHERIGVTVDPDLRYAQSVAARLTLPPELAARTAEEVGKAGLERGSHGSLVRMCEHADLAGVLVLNDDGNEPRRIPFEL